MAKPDETSTVDDAILALRTYGLEFPGATIKTPWPGHKDLAVKDKTFCYLPPDGGPFSIGCKLPKSAAVALLLPYCKPTPYGLGKAGWVTAEPPEDQIDVEMFKQWIDESYRAQAPKKWVEAIPYQHLYRNPLDPWDEEASRGLPMPPISPARERARAKAKARAAAAEARYLAAIEKEKADLLKARERRAAAKAKARAAAAVRREKRKAARAKAVAQAEAAKLKRKAAREKAKAKVEAAKAKARARRETLRAARVKAKEKAAARASAAKART